MWLSALHFFSLLSWFVPGPNSAPLAFCAAFFLPQPLYWHHSYSNGPQQEQNQTQAAHKSSLPRLQGRHKPPWGPNNEPANPISPKEDKARLIQEEIQFSAFYWSLKTNVSEGTCLQNFIDFMFALRLETLKEKENKGAFKGKKDEPWGKILLNAERKS